MTEGSNASRKNKPIPTQDDKTIMDKIRKILSKGNNAEVKRAKDGSFAVMEVKKSIV